MFSTSVLIWLSVSVWLCVGQQIPNETWGYVTVRPEAHMFWWLYGSTAENRDSRPLVMWLQGGPGASSTGFGNFEEIGPLDVNLQPRNTTWIQAANVLFVDNPVGTGYSYCDSDSAFTTDVSQIATDLLTLFSVVLNKLPIFENLPFYIFSESYGGKMTAAFGLSLYEAIQGGKVKCNFQGVALGDSWISPIDSVKTWGPYLYATSLLNDEQLILVEEVANKTEEALKKGQFEQATQLWDEAETLIEQLTDNVDFYNILLHNAPDSDSDSKQLIGREKTTWRLLHSLPNDQLSQLMNGPIRQHLGDIPSNVTWGGQANEVFSKQTIDFMKDVISTVDKLLENNVTVVVYSGQLDLIVDTMGTLAWIKKLQWSGLPSFMKAQRVPLYPPSGLKTKNTGAFLQHYDNFSVYWIMKAGHMVPADAAEMALSMLKMVIRV